MNAKGDRRKTYRMVTSEHEGPRIAVEAKKAPHADKELICEAEKVADA